jgi:hypothetical protein
MADEKKISQLLTKLREFKEALFSIVFNDTTATWTETDFINDGTWYQLDISNEVGKRKSLVGATLMIKGSSIGGFMEIKKEVSGAKEGRVNVTEVDVEMTNYDLLFHTDSNGKFMYKVVPSVYEIYLVMKFSISLEYL